MIALKKVLVATDFSDPSKAALVHGRELARSFGAQLVALHVVDNVMLRAVGGDGFVFVDPELQTNMETAAQKQLDELFNDEDRTLLRAQGVTVTSNAAAFAIVEYAKSHDVNLIVMGTHGRGVMAHLLLGSVAERVVRIAQCPVLTVRHPERELVTVPDALTASVLATG